MSFFEAFDQFVTMEGQLALSAQQSVLALIQS